MTTEISRRERRFERKKKAHFELIKENIPRMTKLKYEIEHINIADYQKNLHKNVITNKEEETYKINRYPYDKKMRKLYLLENNTADTEDEAKIQIKQTQLKKCFCKKNKKYLYRRDLIYKIRYIFKFIVEKFVSYPFWNSMIVKLENKKKFLKINQYFENDLESITVIHSFLFTKWSDITALEIKDRCWWFINDLNRCKRDKYANGYEFYIQKIRIKKNFTEKIP